MVVLWLGHDRSRLVFLCRPPSSLDSASSDSTLYPPLVFCNNGNPASSSVQGQLPLNMIAVNNIFYSISKSYWSIFLVKSLHFQFHFMYLILYG